MTENYGVLGLVGIIAAVAVVGLLINSPSTQPSVLSVEDTGTIKGSSIRGSYDDARDTPYADTPKNISDRKSQFIQRNMNTLTRCQKKVDNKYEQRRLSTQALNRDKEIKECYADLESKHTQNITADDISFTKAKKRKTPPTPGRSFELGPFEVDICIGGLPGVGEICTSDVETVIDIIF